MTKALKIKEKISKNKNDHFVFFYLVSDQVIYSLLFTLHIQLSHPYMTTGKTTALTRQTFVGKVISLFFNMLSRLIITFLPRRKCLFISWLQLPCAFLEPPPKKVCHCLYCFPFYLPSSGGTGCHDFSFLNVEL